MKNAQILALIVVLVLVASGCTSVRGAARDAQNIPLTISNAKDDVGAVGAIYLWPPTTSAAVVDKDGKHCVLAASGVKTTDASSEAAFKLGKALEKIEGLEASMKSAIVESFTKTTAADAHAAFVDVALFHLCMLEQNGAFKLDQPEKRKQMFEAFGKVLEAARNIK